MFRGQPIWTGRKRRVLGWSLWMFPGSQFGQGGTVEFWGGLSGCFTGSRFGQIGNLAFDGYICACSAASQFGRAGNVEVSKNIHGWTRGVIFVD